MNITIDQWQEQLKEDSEAIIIDVRTQEEMDEGCFEKAILLDIKDPPKFMEDAQKLDPSQTYYVYCKSSDRSTQACMVLGSLGFKNLYKLEGGYEGYKEGLKTGNA